MTFTKNDALSAAFIGFYVALLFLMTLGNIKIDNDLIVGLAQSPLRWGLLLMVPFLAVVLLFITYRLSRMKKTNTWFQMGKFLTTGFGNLAVDLGLLNILIVLIGTTTGTLFAIIKGVTFIAAVVHSYLWNKFWTFHKTKTTKVDKEFLIFFIVAIVGLGVNVGVAAFVFSVIPPIGGLGEGVWANVAAFAASIAAFLWNFLGSKFLVFERRSDREEPQEQEHFGGV